MDDKPISANDLIQKMRGIEKRAAEHIVKEIWKIFHKSATFTPEVSITELNSIFSNDPMMFGMTIPNKQGTTVVKSTNGNELKIQFLRLNLLSELLYSYGYSVGKIIRTKTHLTFYLKPTKELPPAYEQKEMKKFSVFKNLFSSK